MTGFLGLHQPNLKPAVWVLWETAQEGCAKSYNCGKPSSCLMGCRRMMGAQNCKTFWKERWRRLWEWKDLDKNDNQDSLPMPLPKKEKASPKHTVKIRKIDHWWRIELWSWRIMWTLFMSWMLNVRTCFFQRGSPNALMRWPSILSKNFHFKKAWQCGQVCLDEVTDTRPFHKGKSCGQVLPPSKAIF